MGSGDTGERGYLRVYYWVEKRKAYGAHLIKCSVLLSSSPLRNNAVSCYDFIIISIGIV